MDTIRSIWEKICKFFSDLWNKITGNSDSNKDNATELQKRIKKLMDDKKEIPAKYIDKEEGEVPKDDWVSCIKMSAISLSGGIEAVTKTLDEAIKETIEILSSEDDVIQNFENDKKVGLILLEQNSNEEDKIIIKHFKPIIQNIAKDKVDEIFKDDKVNKDLLKTTIDNNIVSFLTKSGKRTTELASDEAKKETFPKGTEWKDLYDIAGAVKDAAKIDITTINFSKRINDNKELSNAISNLKKDADDNLKSIINYLKEKLYFAASMLKSAVRVQKKVLDTIEKAVKEAEGAKDDKK